MFHSRDTRILGVFMTQKCYEGVARFGAKTSTPLVLFSARSSATHDSWACSSESACSTER